MSAHPAPAPSPPAPARLPYRHDAAFRPRRSVGGHGGHGGHGVEDAEAASLMARLAPCIARLRREAAGVRPSPCYAFLRPPPAPQRRRLENLALALRRRCDDVVVFGMGAASSCGRALCALNLPPGGLPSPRRRLRLWFVDNADPRTLAALHDSLDSVRTGAVFVSRSGTTQETVEQAAFWRAQRPSAPLVLVTGHARSPLANLCRRQGGDVFVHDPRLSGRFSILHEPSLLPALLAGVDVDSLLAGALSVCRVLREEPALSFPPAQGAAFAVASARRGRTLQVFMPYDDRLEAFAAWQRQLWAESLGKDGCAMTPFAAKGLCDHHGQLQLWLNGAPDKMFTFLGVEDAAGEEEALPPAVLRLARLMHEGRLLAQDVLCEAGRPVRALTFPVLDACVLGALAMHFMLETVCAAFLLGVEPFGQPAVASLRQRVREAVS